LFPQLDLAEKKGHTVPEKTLKSGLEKSLETRLGQNTKGVLAGKKPQTKRKRHLREEMAWREEGGGAFA